MIHTVIEPAGIIPEKTGGSETIFCGAEIKTPVFFIFKYFIEPDVQIEKKLGQESGGTIAVKFHQIIIFCDGLRVNDTQNIFLRFEMIMNRTLTNRKFFADVLESGLFVSFFIKHFTTYRENILLRFHAVVVFAHRRILSLNLLSF